MEDLLDGIRRLVERWVLTTAKLNVNADAGDDTISLVTTSRLSKGDELLIKETQADGTEDTEFDLIIEEVIDKHRIKLVEPLRFNWTVSHDAAVVKTIRHNFVRTFHIGEPDLIQLNELPAITINGTTRTSEWYTTQATKEKFNIEIGIFVADGSMEDGYRFMLAITDTIQAGLKRNIYPLVNAYEQTVLTADGIRGDCYVKVADTTIFKPSGMVLIENAYDSEENTAYEVVDSSTLRLMASLTHDYGATETKVIVPQRFIYNSWPADIQYGKIHKGTLLKAAVINFFAEETEIQGNRTFSGPQLS